MEKKTGTKMRVVKNSAKTGQFSRGDAKKAARTAAAKRSAKNGKSRS